MGARVGDPLGRGPGLGGLESRGRTGWSHQPGSRGSFRDDERGVGRERNEYLLLTVRTRDPTDVRRRVGPSDVRVRTLTTTFPSHLRSRVW